MRQTVVCLIVIALVACGGGATVDLNNRIDTLVDPQTIEAGGTATVTCVLKDEDGREISGATEVVIATPDGVDVESYQWNEADRTITPTKAGDYAIACKSADIGGSDPTPAILHVTPTVPAKTIASVKDSSVLVGIPTEVTCRVEDAYGNVIETATVIDQLNDIEISGNTVLSKKAGTYEITCSPADYSGEIEKIPAVLEVKPGDPAKIEIVVKPELKVYAIDDVVTVTYRALDAYDNVIPDVPGSIEAPLGQGLKAVGGSDYQFKAEGKYEFLARLDPPWDAIFTTKTLVCDVSPPVITILFPDRGMTFMEGQTVPPPGDQTIQKGVVLVKGKVTDSVSDVAGLNINGEKVSPKQDGTFEFPVTSKHGLNVLVVSASDEFGHASRTTRGWYFSNAYLPVKKDSKIQSLLIGEGAAMFLGQEALDDNDHDPSHINDIATILEVVLAGLDLNQLVGNAIPPIELPGVINVPLLNVGGFSLNLSGDVRIDIKITNVELGQPHVTIKSREGGLAFGISFSPLHIAADVKVTLTLNGSVSQGGGNTQTFQLINPSATTGATITVGTFGIDVDMDISKLPGQDVKIAAKKFHVTLEQIDIQLLNSLKFDLGSLLGLVQLPTVDLSQLVGNVSAFIAQYVTNPVLNWLAQVLPGLLEPLITPLIGDLLEQVFNMLNISTTITIPSLIQGLPETQMDVAVNPSSIVFHGQSSVQGAPPAGGRIGLNAGVRTDKGVDRDPLGSILYAQCDGISEAPVLFTFADKPAIQIGVKYDLINEILFMLWWSGMFNGVQIDLSNALGGSMPIPIEGLTVTPTLLLPPIMDDCDDRKQNLQVGDAYLEITGNLINLDMHLGIWLQLRAAANITASGSKITVKIAKLTAFETEIIDINQNMADMLGAIEGLIPSLLGQIEGQEFSFEVPSIPIDGIVPGIPPGTTIKLGNLASYSENGVFVFGGDLM